MSEEEETPVTHMFLHCPQYLKPRCKWVKEETRMSLHLTESHQYCGVSIFCVLCRAFPSVEQLTLDWRKTGESVWQWTVLVAEAPVGLSWMRSDPHSADDLVLVSCNLASELCIQALEACRKAQCMMACKRVYMMVC